MVTSSKLEVETTTSSSSSSSSSSAFSTLDTTNY